MSSFRNWIRGACCGPRRKVVEPGVPKQALESAMGLSVTGADCQRVETDVPEQALIIAPTGQVTDAECQQAALNVSTPTSPVTSAGMEAAAADVDLASCEVDSLILRLRCDEVEVWYIAYHHAANAVDDPDYRRWMESCLRAHGTYTDIGWAAELAASSHDLPRFLHALDNGAFSTGSLEDISPMAVAAKYGALSILDHGLKFRDDFRWNKGVLFCAAHSDNVQAVERALRGGCEPCPLALVIAAERGHLACVRYLHARGFPLWSDIVSRYPDDDGRSWWGREFSDTWLCMPVSGYGIRSLWAIFRYGEVHGAPVPESFAWVVRKRRERAREVLLCFHCAGRQSRAGGEHAHAWRAMAGVPVDVVYVILMAAELEIEETFRPRMY